MSCCISKSIVHVDDGHQKFDAFIGLCSPGMDLLEIQLDNYFDGLTSESLYTSCVSRNGYECLLGNHPKESKQQFQSHPHQCLLQHALDAVTALLPDLATPPELTAQKVSSPASLSKLSKSLNRASAMSAAPMAQRVTASPPTAQAAAPATSITIPSKPPALVTMTYNGGASGGGDGAGNTTTATQRQHGYDKVNARDSTDDSAAVSPSFSDRLYIPVTPQSSQVTPASAYALWEQLYAPARVPLTLERLLYLRLSAKGNGESNDAQGHHYCADDRRWARSLFGEVTTQLDTSAPSASMAPSTAPAAAIAPGEQSRGAPSNAATAQCTSADVEQTSVSTPLRVPQACANAQSASGVDRGRASESRSAATALSHPDAVIASASVPAPLSSVQRGSDSNRDVDNDGGRGSAVLLQPYRGCALSAASPPHRALLAPTSDVSLSCASAAPMSLEQDDSANCIDGNEEAEPCVNTWSVEAASAAPALHMHTPSTSAAAVRTDEKGRRDGSGRDAGCSPPLEHSAYRGSDGESRGAVDDEQAHTLAQQEKAAESCGAWESATATTTPVRSYHLYCHYRSSHDTGPSAEGGGRNEEEDAEHGERGEEDGNDVGFLSLATSPSAGAPEQWRPCPVVGTYAGLSTPSPKPIVVLEDTMTALAVSALPCGLTRNGEDSSQLDSPIRRRHTTRVSTSMSPVADPNGLVFSPPCRQQMRLRLQRRRPRQASEGSDLEYSPHTPVPGSPSQSPLPPPSCWSTPLPQERCPRDAQTPPTPTALSAASQPPASPAPSPTNMADSGAGATDELCAGNHAADAAVMGASPPQVIHLKKEKAVMTVSNISQESRTSADTAAKEDDAKPRDATAPDSPVDASSSAEAGDDGQGRRDGGSVAPVAVGVEDERVGGDEEDAEGDAGEPASTVSFVLRNGALPPRREVSLLKAMRSVAYQAHESFNPSKHREEPQQRHPHPSLPEDRAARRSVSNMDFRWADEADDILRRQQQRVHSLQAARTATLAGGDTRCSPSTSRCSPGGGPRRYTPLSQDGETTQGSQSGNGTRLARAYGGSEASYSVSPQPQDPRTHHYHERAMMRPEGMGVEAVASHTDGSSIVTEQGDVAPSSYRAGRSEELACLSVTRSGEGRADIAFATASSSTPPTAPLRQPPLASVAEATAADDASMPHTDRLHQQQQQPSPRHAGTKRLRENNGGDDGRSDAVHARRSPAPSSVPASSQTVTKRKKSGCSGGAQSTERRHRADDRARLRQNLRGDTAAKATTRSILCASPANVFALPRTISADPGASIATPTFTTAAPLAGPSLSLLRPRSGNCVSDPPSAAKAPKSAKGKSTHVSAPSLPITAAASPPRENASSSRAHKTAQWAARCTPSLEATNKRREEVKRHQYGNNHGGNAPPPLLTPEEKAARDARLQREHESYIRSIATMRSLPRLRSTIAGAGGKTNTNTRIAEEREEKVTKLESIQAKKRSRRAAKKAKKKQRLEEKLRSRLDSDSDVSSDGSALSSSASASSSRDSDGDGEDA
ncbi:hypothetical protein CGC21_2750 [Leishmania donovani]|uniref:Uncharacterized protein n=1 Tax=Leishmania donovani TaxID=5661 RepID=A0A504XR34_LEIDO|nr:hypothetical protein CGC21_2750 [Leishmania donovani]